MEEISAQDIDNVKVSSTKIRRAIDEGDIETANSYLGHPFPLSGVVIGGEKLGRELGYPTANIKIGNKYKLSPPKGVYAVQLSIDGKKYNGMLNIGNRPTFSAESKTTIEVHLLDFKGDLYGEYLQLQLFKRLREEKKFESKDDLIKEIQKDEVRTRNYFDR